MSDPTNVSELARETALKIVKDDRNVGSLIRMEVCIEIALSKLAAEKDAERRETCGAMGKIINQHARTIIDGQKDLARNAPSITDAAKEIIKTLAAYQRLGEWIGDKAHLSEVESILSRLRDAQAGEVRRLQLDAKAMDWIVAHVDYIILRPDTLPLSFREKWDSRIVTRENIYSAMQPSEEPKA